MPDHPAVRPPANDADAPQAGFLRRLLRLLTFVDLPIKHKFLLFAVGTLFWFGSMAVVTVFSLTAIHYKYHQVSEQAVPYSQGTGAVLAHLNNLDRDLRLILEADIATELSGIQSARDHVKAIRSVNAELGLRHSDASQSGNIVENVLQTLAKANPEGVQYLQSLLAITDRIDRSLDDFILEKRQPLNGAAADTLLAAYDTVNKHVAEAIALTARHAEHVAEEYRATNDDIYGIIRNSVHAIIAVMIIASTLLILFVRWMIVAFQQPIEAIIHQIESLSTGDIDLAKKVSIKSKDEIGTLSKKFNSLMDRVYGMTIYKRVIEEDTALEDVYRRLGEVFERDLDITDYTIYEVNTHSKEMRVAYPPLVGEARLHCHDEVLADCTQCRAVKTGHNVSSFEFAGVCRSFAGGDDIGHVCIPMMAGGQAGGVVQLRFAAGQRGASLDGPAARKLFNAEGYINQSLSVIEAKRLMQTLRDSAMVDPLTGLYNRRFLQDHSKQLISGVLRRNKQIGLLVCDLDYFKQVNDTHGHDVGDQILKETSMVLKGAVRDADVVIRFGGEEFLVLLLDVEPGDAMVVAEKIREKVQKMKVNVGDKVLEKTISIGVAEFPHDTDGFWQAIKYADVALYRAKEGGRNRAVRFTPDMWQHGSF